MTITTTTTPMTPAEFAAAAAALCGPGEAALVMITTGEGLSYCVSPAQTAHEIARDTAAAGPALDDGDTLLGVAVIGADAMLTEYPVRATGGTPMSTTSTSAGLTVEVSGEHVFVLLAGTEIYQIEPEGESWLPGAPSVGGETYYDMGRRTVLSAAALPGPHRDLLARHAGFIRDGQS